MGWPSESDHASSLVWTDRDGRFRVTGLTAGEWMGIRACGPGMRSAELVLEETLRPGETVHVEFVLEVECEDEEGPWVVSGVVVDPEGRPVEGAEVGGGEMVRGPLEGWTYRTGEDGRFEVLLASVPGPSVADLFMEVEAEERGTLRVKWRPEHRESLDSTGKIEGLRLVLREPATVRGRVLDADGEPIDGATVRLVEGSGGDRNPSWVRDTRTDDAGRYEISAIDPQEDFFLLADDDLLVSRYVPLAGRLLRGATATVDIPMPPRREVALEVTVIGWLPGMSLTTDCIGSEMEGPVSHDEEYAGPHRFTLYHASDHPVAFAETDIPYDAESWSVVIEAKPCQRCARGEPVEEE